MDRIILTHNDIVGFSTSTDEGHGSIMLAPKDYWLDLKILKGKKADTFTLKKINALADEITEAARALGALHLQLVSRKTRVRFASLRKRYEQGSKSRADHSRPAKPTRPRRS